MCEDATINDTVYSCPLGKPLHHQDALHVPEDCGYLLASRGNCLKFLGPRASVMLPVYGLLPIPYNDDLQSSVCKSVHTSWKTGLLHPSGSYQKDGNSALTSVGSMWSVLKCDCMAVFISQPVFQESPNHFWMTLILHLAWRKGNYQNVSKG
jgi:hypothetical protein